MKMSVLEYKICGIGVWNKGDGVTTLRLHARVRVRKTGVANKD